MSVLRKRYKGSGGILSDAQSKMLVIGAFALDDPSLIGGEVTKNRVLMKWLDSSVDLEKAYVDTSEWRQSKVTKIGKVQVYGRFSKA